MDILQLTHMRELKRNGWAECPAPLTGDAPLVASTTLINQHGDLLKVYPNGQQVRIDERHWADMAEVIADRTDASPPDITIFPPSAPSVLSPWRWPWQFGPIAIYIGWALLLLLTAVLWLGH